MKLSRFFALVDQQTHAALGILEQYLVESITMKGLDRQSLKALWLELFRSTPQHEIIDALHRVTKGNPLAVRSGLRGAIQTGSILHSKHSGKWECIQSPALFEQNLRRSVSLVSRRNGRPSEQRTPQGHRISGHSW